MYQYKHANGKVIDKVDFVVDMAGGANEYFEGPLVVAWWHISNATQECDQNIEAYEKYGKEIPGEKGS